MQDTALSYIRGQYSWKKDQEKDLERLNTMLTEILTIVDVIEKREIKNGNQRKLLGILKNAIYSAVDVLDSFQYMVLHSKVIRQSTVTLVTTSFVEMGKRMLGTTKFRRKLTDILEKLGEVKTSADTLLRVVTFDKATAKLLLVTQLRVTSPLKEKNHIYGRRAELDKLRDMLLEVSDNSEPGPSESSVPVISIVGVGGIGKTSLAQVAFNDEQIRMNFTHRIWVSVSDSYDENALHEKMEGKKFLLVLDDVCFCSLPSDLNTVEPLDTLVICGCPMMTFLPQDGLPASMQMILLSRCHPEFDSQLQRKEGAEWNKIAHIPEKKLEIELNDLLTIFSTNSA
ncbi:hypothetical protein QOZ80_6AG0545150 [Eleusine coracana subsp. coracana]|nr:hypothetical protein QOZ80_6AG0545150 [Eleusine coracana subsp. coracana]